MNGGVLVAGGFDNNGAFLKSAELYDPRLNRWAPTGSMLENLSGQTATLLQDGRVLVVGGQCGLCSAPSTEDAELYNPTTGTWSWASAMSVGRYLHTATLLQDGRVLVAGGYGEAPGQFEGQTWATAEIYNPANNTWSAAGSMSTARARAAATLLKDGQVLVSGGECDANGCITNSTDLYDPTTNTWSPTAAMLLQTFDHRQFALPNGRVIAVGGGIPSTGATAEVEIYDPRAGTWTPGPSTLTPTEGVVGGVLSDGAIILAGGYQGPDPTFSQVYLPGQQTWVPAGDNDTQRNTAVGASLDHNRFLLAGGWGGSFPTFTQASAEIFQASGSAK